MDVTKQDVTRITAGDYTARLSQGFDGPDTFRIDPPEVTETALQDISAIHSHSDIMVDMSDNTRIPVEHPKETSFASLEPHEHDVKMGEPGQQGPFHLAGWTQGSSLDWRVQLSKEEEQRKQGYAVKKRLQIKAPTSFKKASNGIGSVDQRGLKSVLKRLCHRRITDEAFQVLCQG